MRIVRVAHFSFISHVEVTLLLLQSNSEEIERISFIQNYKRKVVKSKAMIQPFATKKIMADDSNKEETVGARVHSICVHRSEQHAGQECTAEQDTGVQWRSLCSTMPITGVTAINGW
jgi:hypothetical protein